MWLYKMIYIGPNGGALFDRNYLPTSQALQVARRQPKYCVWATCRSPDFVILQQILVNEGFKPLRVSNRRYPAHSKPRVLPHKIRVSFLNLLANQNTKLLLIHAI